MKHNQGIPHVLMVRGKPQGPGVRREVVVTKFVYFVEKLRLICRLNEHIFISLDTLL